jgi:hydrogenase maturation protease
VKTVVVGLGNPILSDDGVGIRVVRELKRRVPGASIVELGAGGIRLLDVLPGFERVLIVDAMVTGEMACGKFRRFSLDELRSKSARTCNTLCVHDMDLPTAMALGHLAGMELPEEVVIWGVEVKDVETFAETLSPTIEAAVPMVVDEMYRELLREKAWVTSSGSISATAAQP